ncbi:MAG TPA: cytochrome c3 family protein, partial [Coriobacteriia bacterium]
MRLRARADAKRHTIPARDASWGLALAVGLALALVAASPTASSANPHGAFTKSTTHCWTCHDLHAATTTVLPLEQRFLLKQPGEKQLCYVCHDGTQSVYNAQAEFGESVLNTSTRASDHGVGVQSCRACHTPHRGPAEGNAMSLSAGPSRASTGTPVCGACHGAGTTLPEGDKVSLFPGTAHDTSTGDPAAIACMSCHQPHGSDNVSLLAGTVRSIGGVTGTVSVTATTGSTPMCIGCHDVIDGTYAGPAAFLATKHGTEATSSVAATQWPATGLKPGDCENCHDPHGTGRAKVLRATGDALCFTCHDAAGTSRPDTYSYQGQVRSAASGHGAIDGNEVPGLVTLAPGTPGFAAWESTTAPTPASPGTPMSAEKVARLSAADGTYAVTSLASITGQHDYQVYRFKSPSSGARTNWLRLNWIGYGEELAGYETSVSVWSSSANGGLGGWVRFANGVFGDRTSVTSQSVDPSDIIDGGDYVWMMADAKKVIQSTIVATPSVSSVTPTQISVTWTTAGYASSWVDFGPTSAYGSTVGTDTRSITHTVLISVAAGTRYHLRAYGTAREGDSATSADMEFIPVLTPPTLAPVASQAAPTTTFLVSFSWSFADTETAPYTYDVHIWSGSPPYDQTFSGLTTTTTSATLVTYPYSTATYYWSARARNSVGTYSPWAANGTFTLTDTSVWSGSCPFLFTWDGMGWVFGADQYATGKLGTKSATGYLKPTPQDAYVLG